ncbi:MULTISPECIES: FtsW/RodA/SpoVE family cell cycle protein [Saccharopolyspora]|uniref:FtsW/RodA/SpoVE family cell cycle protein n=2 Tax=Saccharopolyspora TaxID=1835 RepID=A0A4R5BLR1_9PSEU|nr:MULTISPECIES: FtsW/RodA/SpoVE family cell cycle protein [Saccharopolyspora]MBQ0922384.1 FtsW/RodA/SpoVE family cell cycle protein [Saccharopolyspora endophytica]TDD84832.1 FtsW/RodA/SpoVE family cell cycle protein [Saccharopolyspora karakumensis]
MSEPAATTGAVNGAPRVNTRRGTELFMLVFSAIIVTAALIVVEVSQEQTLTRELLFYGVAFLILYGAAHFGVRYFAPYADPLILPLVALINGLGLVMLHRLDLAPVVGAPYTPKQILYTTAGVAMFILVLWLVKDHRTLAQYGYTCGFVGIALLALPGVLPASISEANGAKLWVNLGFISIQPSEFAKILLLIFFASFLVGKRELFTTAGKRFLGVDWPRPRDLGPVLVAWVLSIGIVVLEKDLGTSLLFFGIVLVMIYIATERAVWVGLGLTMFAVGAVIAFNLFSHVQVRVNTWLDPMMRVADGESDPGYQLRTGLFGMAHGGIPGSGLGSGMPNITPLSFSDFIIPALGEELGLIGLMSLLLVYVLLMMRGLRSALAVRDSFGKLFAGGLSFTIALQLFVVAGGSTGLIPMTGLTAPFLAAGGSSMLANYVLIALLLRVSDAARRPQAPAKPKPKQAPIAEAHTELVERPR